MSSPSSTITIIKVNKTEVDFRIRPELTTVGTLNGYGFTRSYVLAALGWFPYILNSKLYQIDEFTITNKINNLEDINSYACWAVDEGFYEKHISKFITNTSILNSNFNATIEEEPNMDELVSLKDSLSQNEDLSDLEKENLLSEKFAPVLLRATFTSEELISDLKEGMIIETTAQDRWWEDPTNPY